MKDSVSFPFLTELTKLLLMSDIINLFIYLISQIQIIIMLLLLSFESVTFISRPSLICALLIYKQPILCSDWLRTCQFYPKSVISAISLAQK